MNTYFLNRNLEREEFLPTYEIKRIDESLGKNPSRVYKLFPNTQTSSNTIANPIPALLKEKDNIHSNNDLPFENIFETDEKLETEG